MTTLSTEDNTRQSADDRDPDGLNPVIEVMGKSWQRLFAQSAWKPQQLPFRGLLQEQAHTLRRGLRGGRFEYARVKRSPSARVRRSAVRCERDQGIFSRLG